MRIVGLTGGIASGKSAVAAVWRSLGVLVIDADQLAKDVVKKGEPAFDQIVQQWGSTVLAADGELDRARLGELVFANVEQRKVLEGITHPAVAAAFMQACQDAVKNGTDVVVYDVPLLVEKNLHTWMSAVVVVEAPQEVRVTRLMARNGLTAEQALTRVHAQATDEERRRVATVVIRNDGTLDELRMRAVEVAGRLALVHLAPTS